MNLTTQSQEVADIAAAFGMGELQALRHVQGREIARHHIATRRTLAAMGQERPTVTDTTDKLARFIARRNQEI